MENESLQVHIQANVHIQYFELQRPLYINITKDIHPSQSLGCFNESEDSTSDQPNTNIKILTQQHFCISFYLFLLNSTYVATHWRDKYAFD